MALSKLLQVFSGESQLMFAWLVQGVSVTQSGSFLLEPTWFQYIPCGKRLQSSSRSFSVVFSFEAEADSGKAVKSKAANKSSEIKRFILFPPLKFLRQIFYHILSYFANSKDFPQQKRAVPKTRNSPDF